MIQFFKKPLSTMTKKWRIFHEESADLNPREERTDFEELRGAGDTRIYRYGQEVLAVSTETQRYTNLSRILGLTPKSGCVLLFPDELLDTVAEAIHAKHRRQFSPEQLAEQRIRMAHASASLNRPVTGAIQAPKSDASPSERQIGHESERREIKASALSQ